jgi:hypothetical protein
MQNNANFSRHKFSQTQSPISLESQILIVKIGYGKSILIPNKHQFCQSYFSLHYFVISKLILQELHIK